jgi:MYXO-CTERM domain-containing protein
VALGNLASTNTSPYVEQTLGITVSAPVPEPTTGAMAALAAAALLLHGRRRTRRDARGDYSA